MAAAKSDTAYIRGHECTDCCASECNARMAPVRVLTLTSSDVWVRMNTEHSVSQDDGTSEPYLAESVYTLETCKKPLCHLLSKLENLANQRDCEWDTTGSTCLVLLLKDYDDDMRLDYVS